MIRLLIRNKNPIKLFFINQGSNPITHLRFIYNPISKPPEEPNQNQPSLTVSYLINSCGLSPQSALSAAKKITIKTTKKPDSVINVLKSYGFATTQIAKLIEKSPRILSSNPNNTIKPKLDFFLGVGFSSTQLTEIITLCPCVLIPSLENRVKPNFDSLTSVFDTNQQISVAIRRNFWLLTDNLETNFLPNVRILQCYGVPGPNIAKLATLHPRALTQPTERFKVTVESIRDMGFDPSSTKFFRGVTAMVGLTPLSWERKVAVYRSLGWTEAEIISAFTRQPFSMLLSEDNIRRSVDFFVKEMHWGPSFLAANPEILTLSLEKRVIPRCSALNVLASKGLVRKQRSARFLKISEKDFITKYVIKYQNQVPEVLQAYDGNLGFVGIESL